MYIGFWVFLDIIFEGYFGGVVVMRFWLGILNSFRSEFVGCDVRESVENCRVVLKMFVVGNEV